MRRFEDADDRLIVDDRMSEYFAEVGGGPQQWPEPSPCPTCEHGDPDDRTACRAERCIRG